MQNDSDMVRGIIDDIFTQQADTVKAPKTKEFF